MSEVRQLRPLGSKFDIISRGRVIRLILDPCSCGVHAKWIYDRRVSDYIPALWNSKQTFQEVLMQWHWKPNWWQRLFRRKMETALVKWIHQTRKELLECLEREARLEKIRDSLLKTQVEVTD